MVGVRGTASSVRDHVRRAGTPAPLSGGELGVAGALLAGFGALVFGTHVAHGGFWLDDWTYAADYRFASPPHYLNAAESFRSFEGGRPLLALALFVPHALFGLDTRLHHALALVLGVLTAWLFFVVLRMVRIPLLPALAIAGLAFVFPWTDSVRLWPAASINDLAVIFYLLAVIIGLRAVNAERYWAVLGRAAADVFFVASVLTYEAAAAAALLTGILYFTRTTPRRALMHWAADVLVLVGALMYALVATSGARGVGTAHQALANVRYFAHDAVGLLPQALVPITLPGPVKAVILLLVALIICLGVRRTMTATDPTPRRWLVSATAAGVAIAASDVMFLSKGPFPLDPGRNNRVNLLAALPWALLVYSVLALLAMLVPARVALVSPATLALLLAIGVGAGYIVKVRHDASAWERAADLQRPVLQVLRTLPPLPNATVIYTFGHPSQVSPEIYVFAKVYDLDGAARITLHNPSIHAYPISAPVRLVCTQSGIVPNGIGAHIGPGQAARYGHALFVNVLRRRWSFVQSRAQCATSLRTFTS